VIFPDPAAWALVLEYMKVNTAAIRANAVAINLYFISFSLSYVGS
jgi:hypothetical protein